MARDNDRPRQASPAMSAVQEDLAAIRDLYRKLDARMTSLELFVRRQSDTEQGETSLTKSSIIKLMKHLGMIQP